ncbi:MAG: phosphotransferase [Alphaproteobacteria bacterium]|nr:phosphotransferase [Alphaproteobacteria bacterium]
MSDRAVLLSKFLDKAGWGAAERLALPGDASTRRYIRLHQGERTALLMDQPQSAEAPTAPADAGPDERRALGYNAVARLAGADCGRFVAAAEFLSSLGLSAPHIYAADPTLGFVLMEDLGNALFADVLNDGGSEVQLYAAAADVLARLHAQTAPAALHPDKPLFAYDETALLAEIDLLTEWFFPVALKRQASEDEVAEHRDLWRKALALVPAAPPVFVHRDYHAQNLLWLPERAGAARVGLIDFQDAVAGAKAYDLISLTEDARRDVAPALRHHTVAHYLDSMYRQGTPVDEAALAHEMALYAAQRNVKIVGIFARLFRRDGKARYLDYLPRVWGYLGEDLAHPALQPLQSWYAKKIPGEARDVPDGGGP